MIKAEIYSDINKKTAQPSAKITDEEALVRALDLLDFHRSLVSLNAESNHLNQKDSVDWIELYFHGTK